jgi:methanogenic corrinoid protein MtbC1
LKADTQGKVVAGDAERGKALTIEAINEAWRAGQLVNRVLILGLDAVGQRLERPELFGRC